MYFVLYSELFNESDDGDLEDEIDNDLRLACVHKVVHVPMGRR